MPNVNEAAANSASNTGASVDPWLGGYFDLNDEADVQGGNRKAKGKWKNWDFLRLRDVALHLLAPSRGKVILDIGCANGATMVYCGLQGAKVYGQDLDAQHVAEANAYMRRFGLDGEAVVGDATVLTFADNMFDGVIASDFVEHITDDVKVKVLRAIRRVLKPGAPFITKTPNLAYLKLSLAYKRLHAIAQFKNPMKLVIPHTPGTDDPQHIGLTTRWAYTRCLQEAGFLNYEFHHPPLRRFGFRPAMEVASSELPVVRDFLCEDLVCRAYKPIVSSHFPD